MRRRRLYVGRAAQGLSVGDHRHGTEAGYVYHKCRCQQCRDAHSARANEMRAARTLQPDDPRHGLRSTYCNYDCRCVACSGAERAYHQERRQRLGHW